MTTSVVVRGDATRQLVASTWHWIGVVCGRAGRVLTYAFMLLWCIVSLACIGWILMTSLKTNQELFANVWALPTRLHWENYATAWVSARMSKYFLNSVSVSVVGVGLTALIASMAAYILARFRFRGSGVLLGIFISGLAIPLELILVPVYLIFHALKLSNSLVALTALYAAVSLPFSIFVLTGFFRTLPRELEEAAVLDGASEYGVFWRVMMPLVRPGLITVSVFNFLFCWNEYMLALFLLSKAENMTVPVGLYNLKSVQGYRGDWVSMFAGLMIVLLPTAVIFLIAQRRIVGGLTLGALKG